MTVVNNVNSVIMEGYLPRDGEFREPKPGFRVVEFPIATRRVYKKKDGQIMEETSYFDVKAVGQWVDYCQENAKKGAAVKVVGSLVQNRWKDEDGKPRSKVRIVAEHLEFTPAEDQKQGWQEAVKRHEDALGYLSVAKAAYKEAEIQSDVVF